MSQCPLCGNELSLNMPAEYNAELSDRSLVAVAKCCGGGVILRRTIIVKAVAYTGDRLTDDWGNDIKPFEAKP